MVVLCIAFGYSDKFIINKGFNPLDMTCKIVDGKAVIFSNYFHPPSPPLNIDLVEGLYTSRVLCVWTACLPSNLGSDTWQFKDLKFYGDARWKIGLYFQLFPIRNLHLILNPCRSSPKSSVVGPPSIDEVTLEILTNTKLFGLSFSWGFWWAPIIYKREKKKEKGFTGDDSGFIYIIWVLIDVVQTRDWRLKPLSMSLMIIAFEFFLSNTPTRHLQPYLLCRGLVESHVVGVLCVDYLVRFTWGLNSQVPLMLASPSLWDHVILRT